MNDRELTACRSRRNYEWPSIILDGKWLKESGFAPGDKVLVRCEDVKLTIQNTGRKWCDAEK